MQVNGCMCGCGRGGWRYSAGFAPPWAREQRLEWLEEYQRDLEQSAADVADEISRMRNGPGQPADRLGSRPPPEPAAIGACVSG